MASTRQRSKYREYDRWYHQQNRDRRNAYSKEYYLRVTKVKRAALKAARTTSLSSTE